MRRDSKLSSTLHVLLHMAQSARPLTSEEIGAMLRTNPVVVRRTLAGLRDFGWVTSAKGHGGGWSLSADWGSLTLADVHRALGEPAMVLVGHRSDNPTCLIAQAVQGALDEAIREADAVLMAKLSTITLAYLAAEFRRCAPPEHLEKHFHGH